jgi:hypothetical protein
VPVTIVATVIVVRPIASNSVKTGTNKVKTGARLKDVRL